MKARCGASFARMPPSHEPGSLKMKMPTGFVMTSRFLAALMLCIPLSAHSEYFASYAQCWQSYLAARDAASRLVHEFSNCIVVGKGGCKAIDSAGDVASKRAVQISHICSQMKQNEYMARSAQRQQAQQREQQQRDAAQRAAQARDQYNRDQADQQRAQIQRQQAAYSANQAKAQAIGGLIGGLLGLLNSNNNSSARSNPSPQISWDQDAAQQRADLERQAASANEANQRYAAEQQKRVNDQSTYDRLVAELNTYKDAKERFSTASEYVTNPFGAAAKLAGEGMSNGVTGAAVNSVFPGREGSDSRYDQMASVVDSARSRALSGNPFAESVSNVSMGGVNSVNRKAFGELDRAGSGIQNFGNDNTPASSGTGTAYHSSYSPPVSSGSSESSYTYPPPSQFNAPATRYYDPDTRATLEVPAGYVLYRAPESKKIVVVNYAQITEPPASGDRPWLGARGCGTGLGIVTPECEKIRRNRANPFGAAK